MANITFLDKLKSDLDALREENLNFKDTVYQHMDYLKNISEEIYPGIYEQRGRSLSSSETDSLIDNYTDLINFYMNLFEESLANVGAVVDMQTKMIETLTEGYENLS